MRFQVPQFIEVEDKIFGQLTLKQFIYLAGGAGLSFIVYVLLKNLFLASVPIIIIMSVSAAFAFFNLYRRFSFISIVEAAFKYYIGDKLYIWKKEATPKPKDTAAAIHDAKNFASVMVPKISNSKLKDLTWSLDIKESMYSNRNQR